MKYFILLLVSCIFMCGCVSTKKVKILELPRGQLLDQDVVVATIIVSEECAPCRNLLEGLYEYSDATETNTIVVMRYSDLAEADQEQFTATPSIVFANNEVAIGLNADQVMRKIYE